MKVFAKIIKDSVQRKEIEQDLGVEIVTETGDAYSISTDGNGRLVIKSINGYLSIEPESTNSIILEYAK